MDAAYDSLTGKSSCIGHERSLCEDVQLGMPEPTLTVSDLGGLRVAEVNGAGFVLSSELAAVDIVGNAAFQEVDGVLLRAEQLAPEFFDLSSQLAGDVLQKFSNYRVRLAVIGDLATTSPSLRAFITESNQGKQVAFLPDRAAALVWLKQGR